jgi:hypothetical protein
MIMLQTAFQYYENSGGVQSFWVSERELHSERSLSGINRLDPTMVTPLKQTASVECEPR